MTSISRDNTHFVSLTSQPPSTAAADDLPLPSAVHATSLSSSFQSRGGGYTAPTGLSSSISSSMGGSMHGISMRASQPLLPTAPHTATPSLGTSLSASYSRLPAPTNLAVGTTPQAISLSSSLRRMNAPAVSSYVASATPARLYDRGQECLVSFTETVFASALSFAQHHHLVQ